jgi:multidrug efflux pump subunit AcrA (membrane-fusion protein)
VTAAVGAAVAGALAVNAVAGASGSGGYRTATVQRASVDQALHDTGTVSPVSQATVAFPVAGTVATVDVAAGAAVTTGQTLATLDGEALQRAVNEAQAAVDQAELALAQARSGETPTGNPTGASDGLGALASLDTGSGDDSIVLASATQDTGPQTDPELAAAQQAVLDGQREVDDRLVRAQDALDSADRICAAVGEDDDPAPTDTTSSTSSTSTTAPSTTTTADDGTAPIEACRAALGTVLDAQRSVSAAQVGLAQAAAALDDLLAQRAAQASQDGADGTDGIEGGDGSNDDGISGDGDPEATGSTSPSSADLIAYQKAVDAAEAALLVAQQAVKQATIVSPIDGTVVAVDLAVGDAVEAGSSTARIVVVGPGGYEVTATIGVDQLPDIDLGQRATVQPDGSDRTLTGEVVAIGLAATSSDSGATTYPVTIALDDDEGLRNGMVASVSIVTDASDGALVVPTSAVRPTGGSYVAMVLEDGAATATDVEVGAVGATWTEVTSGLEEGDEVVLADLDEPLPSSATDSSNGGDGDRFGPGGDEAPVIRFERPDGGVKVG